MQKALIAYLWDDVPAGLRARLPAWARPPQVLLVVPARWAARRTLPEALASLVAGYAGAYWGQVERFHEPDGSLLIVCHAQP